MVDIKNIEKRLSVLADGEKCIITKVEDIEEGAHLVKFVCNGELDCSCVVYDDGTLFHLRDWQSGYPNDEVEIASYDWVTEDNWAAIIFNGLPRKI